MRKKHKKGIAKIIVLMTISLSMLMLVNNTFEIISSTITGITDSVFARRISINFDWEEYYELGDDVLEKLSSLKNKHILGAYAGGETGGYVNESKKMGVTYVPENVLEEYMNNTKGFTLKDNEVILPKYVNSENGYIELIEDECVGKELEYTLQKIKYTYESAMQYAPTTEILDERIYKLKVIGLYDNAKSGMDCSDLIVSNKTLLEMKNFTKAVQEEDSEVAYASSDTQVDMYVTIDDYQSSEEVLECVQAALDEYEGYGFYADDYSYYATDEFYSLSAIKLLANIVASFLLVCASLSLFSYIKDMMNRRKQEFGIMKAIGYKTSGICKTLIKELILEITIPLGTSLALGLGSVIVADNYFKNSFDIYEYALMEIKLFPEILALVGGIAVILPLIGYGWTIVKINRLEPMEALKGSEGRV